MKATIESTNMLTSLDGVPVRVWEGITENGVIFKAFIHRIAVSQYGDSAELERELKEELPPGRTVHIRDVL